MKQLVWRGSWPDAVIHCTKYKMCLADIGTEITLQQLISKLKDTDLKEYWFGLNAYNKTSFSHLSIWPLGPRWLTLEAAPIGSRTRAHIHLIHACDLRKKFICVRAEMRAGLHLEKEKHECVISEEDRAIVDV